MSVEILTGDCREVLAQMEADSFDACVCDPPYGLGFMSRHWDAPDNVAFRPETWAAVYRVLKPGAHLLAFGGTRTYHRLVCAIEDAGFEIRDTIMWIYGCLSEDTEILVDGRWEPYHNAIAGRRALCYDVDHDEYSWQPIQELYVYDYDDTAFRICSDRTDQIVSRNHRCLVERGGRLVFEIAEEAARQRQARVPILESLPELLGGLPLPDERAGCAEQDVQPRMRGCSNFENSPALQETNSGTARSDDCLRGVRQGEMATSFLAEAHAIAGLLTAMQWDASWSGIAEACAQRTRCLDRNEHSQLSPEDEWIEQSCLERRGDVLPQGGELQADQVRALPARIPADGSEGWLRHGASPHRGAGDWPLPSAIRGGAPREPRPAVERPGQPDTLCEQSGSQALRASRFTRTDLARIEPVHYRGIVWCVKVPTGVFVARRNGKIFVTGNSGFPKSLDVSKAIDRRGGNVHLAAEIAEAIKTAREARGWTTGQADRHFCGGSTNWTWYEGRKGICRPPTPDDFARIVAEWPELTPLAEAVEAAEREIVAERMMVQGGGISLQLRMGEHREVRADITAPATEAARQWQGWGTALKPACELICVARKPLSESSVAANVLRWGTGAINVDACRVATGEVLSRGVGKLWSHYRDRTENRIQAIINYDKGRWPANCVHDGSPEVLAAFARFGESTSLGGDGYNHSMFCGGKPTGGHGLGDTGTAARFFYTAKAGADDRCDSKHPTVKPVALMEWLVTLVTPRRGRVLDPFCGTGSTLVACDRLGFDAIGIEQDAQTVADAHEKIRRFRARRAIGEVSERREPIVGQLGLDL